jgi:hypothetical protein
MRRVLLVLLGFGVFAGYGSAIANARFHMRHRGESCGWSREYQRPEEARPAVAAPPQQTVVVPQAAPAPAQQIFLIMPGAQAAQGVPQLITVPVPAAAPAAPAAAAAPVPANP